MSKASRNRMQRNSSLPPGVLGGEVTDRSRAFTAGKSVKLSHRSKKQRQGDELGKMQRNKNTRRCKRPEDDETEHNKLWAHQQHSVNWRWIEDRWKPQRTSPNISLLFDPLCNDCRCLSKVCTVAVGSRGSFSEVCTFRGSTVHRWLCE